MNEYKDTEMRYYHDIAFRNAVEMLKNAAVEYGWTPGELRQIAFCAAMKCEQYAARLTLQAGFDGPGSTGEPHPYGGD